MSFGLIVTSRTAVSDRAQSRLFVFVAAHDFVSDSFVAESTLVVAVAPVGRSMFDDVPEVLVGFAVCSVDFAMSEFVERALFCHQQLSIVGTAISSLLLASLSDIPYPPHNLYYSAVAVAATAVSRDHLTPPERASWPAQMPRHPVVSKSSVHKRILSPAIGEM